MSSKWWAGLDSNPTTKGLWVEAYAQSLFYGPPSPAKPCRRPPRPSRFRHATPAKARSGFSPRSEQVAVRSRPVENDTTLLHTVDEQPVGIQVTFEESDEISPERMFSERVR